MSEPIAYIDVTPNWVNVARWLERNARYSFPDNVAWVAITGGEDTAMYCRTKGAAHYVFVGGEWHFTGICWTDIDSHAYVLRDCENKQTRIGGNWESDK